jgi:beta-fructofuranosidase
MLLRAGDRCALFVCPHPEAKSVVWFAGERENGHLREHQQGKLDFGIYAYAAHCLYDPVRDRHLLWTWIKEGRPGKIRRAAGWAGLLSLPKECDLDVNYQLIVRPAPELKLLRTEGRTIRGQRLTPSSENPFLDFSGDCLEFEVEFSLDEPAIFELTLRATPDGAECTTISYQSTEQLLIVDGSKSSLDPDVNHLIFSGPLAADQNGLVRFHAFLDRSVLEVFLADRACITQRLYPTREDSLGVHCAVKKGAVMIYRLAAWKMASIWRR